MLETVTQAELFQGTEIPQDAQAELIDFYGDRHVFDDEKFLKWWRMRCRHVQRQYLLYLRNDMTEWDPMVADYMERQIKESARANTAQHQKNNSKTRHEGEDVEAHSGIDKEDTTNQGGNTRSIGTVDISTNKATQSGGDVVTEHGSDAGTVQRQDQENVLGRSYSDSRQLQGVTPESSVYKTAPATARAMAAAQEAQDEPIPDVPIPDPIPDVPAPDVPDQEDLPTPDLPQMEFPATPTPVITAPPSGAPDKLNWDYLSSQAETEGDEWTAKNGISGHAEASGSKSHRQVKSELGTTDESQNIRQQGGTVRDNSDLKVGKKTEHGHKITTSKGIVDFVDGGVDSYGSEASGRAHREQYSGRHQAPPELLQAAQEYIVGSNSLKWLIKQFQDLFALTLGGW